MKIQAKTFVLLSICALLLSAVAHADTTTPVLTLTTDAFSGTFAIDIMRDSAGAVTEMSYQTPTNPDGTLTLAELHQGPQVIYNSQGHDVILMSLQSDFDPQKGGHVIMRYLNDGMSGDYKDFRILLSLTSTITLTSDPDSTDPDSDGNTYAGVFNRIFMEKNTFLGTVIGISDVVPSYQP